MTWDCIVVGGGAAGLSAGLVLGRARRRTLIIDKGEPSNRFAHGIGGLLGQDGRAPQDFYADGRKELEMYPSVEYRRGEVTGGAPGFSLTLADGTSETARSIVLATGMDYVYPDVPGVAERWGKTAFHCPFCPSAPRRPARPDRRSPCPWRGRCSSRSRWSRPRA